MASVLKRSRARNSLSSLQAIGEGAGKTGTVAPTAGGVYVVAASPAVRRRLRFLFAHAITSVAVEDPVRMQ